VRALHLFKLHLLEHGNDQRHVDFASLVTENNTALNRFFINCKAEVGGYRNWQILTQLIEPDASIAVPHEVEEAAHAINRAFCDLTVLNLRQYFIGVRKVFYVSTCNKILYYCEIADEDEIINECTKPAEETI